MSSAAKVNNKPNKMLPLEDLMANPANIRNISVIAHVDHGKTTLTDSLLLKCGLIANNKVGDACSTDTMKEEQERGITIKSTSVSLMFSKDEPGSGGKAAAGVDTDGKHDDESKASSQYLVNLIDCPGHVDFNSEVTASLRVTDGALVVVDCIEGVCVQTETVLRQAMEEKIVPILFLNKMDRIFLELNLNNEEIYDKLKKTIESVNTVIQTYRYSGDEGKGAGDEDDGKGSEGDLSASDGRVGFGSALHGWGFTLETFARMYQAKFGIPEKALMGKFWGDWHYDGKLKKWVAFDSQKNAANNKKRGFIKFILKPLKALVTAIMEDKKQDYEKMLKKLGVWKKMQSQCKAELADVKKPKDLLKIAFKTWIPAGDALLDMICQHLPNPIQAQSYRMNHLYNGPLDSKESEVLRSCDSSVGGSGMVFYVSKMVPTNDFSRFIAFGRVFGGTIRTGQEVTILDHSSSAASSHRKIKIQKCYIMMGAKRERIVDCVPCGNVCGLLGLDHYISKSGTIVDAGGKNKGQYDFMPLKTMTFNVSPIVEVAVNCCKQSDLPKLTDALRKLNKFDNLIQIKRRETGEMIVAGAGELHLETCLNTLTNLFLKDNCPIKLSEPIVNYNETIAPTAVAEDSDEKPFTYVSKSPNKHNRLYCNVESLFACGEATEPLLTDLQDNSMYYVNKIKKKEGLKELANNEVITKCLSKEDVLNIWSFGCIPGTSSFTNILCDQSKGVQLLKDIRSDVVNGFSQLSMAGVLCHEEVRGVKFNIVDAKIHSDKMHRNAGAIIPMTRRCLSACQIGHAGSEHARLMEAIYKCEIICHKGQMNGVYNTLNARRGSVVNVDSKIGTPLLKIEATLPVCQSFGFTNLLRKNTQGKAFPSMSFSHWSIVNQDPYGAEDNKVEKLILEIRARKGMKQALPQFSDYYDKIN